MPYFPQMDGAYGSLSLWLDLLKERGGEAAAYEQKVRELLVSMRSELVEEVEKGLDTFVVLVLGEELRRRTEVHASV